ncbi:hypothetical protein GCM10009616_01740 [Microlunatus lacustris]
MHPRRHVPDSLHRLADEQEGVLTREQALGSGLTPPVVYRLLEQGPWQALARGVYSTRSGRPSWAALAWAGVLLGGDRARLGPRASGHLWALQGEPPVVDVLVPHARGRAVAGRWRFERERPGVRSSRTVGEPPRLTAADTVLDLAGQLDDGEVVALVTRAVQQRLVSVERLQRDLDNRSRHPRRRLLRTLLDDVGEGVESPLEVHYLRDVERAHGLPRGRRNRYRGELRHRTDVGYDEFAVLVELDGRLGHEGMGRFRDYRRDNDFAVRQLLTLRYGWTDVLQQHCEVAFQVGGVLGSRGWTDVPTRCRHCLRVL